MQEWLLSIWEEDRKSILFITHNIEEALFLADRIYIFSKCPAVVQNELIVPFSRPRDESLFTNPEFFALKQELFELLRSEVKVGERT